MSVFKEWIDLISNATIEDFIEMREKNEFLSGLTWHRGFIWTYTKHYIVLLDGYALWMQTDREIRSLTFDEETRLGHIIDLKLFRDILRTHLL